MFAFFAFILLLRQLVVYFQYNMFYFSVLIVVGVLLFGLFRRIAFVRLFLDRIDSWFFNLPPLQYLLWLSVKFETCLNSENYFVKQVSFFFIIPLTLGYLYGLVFLLSSLPDPSILQLVEVFILLWISFYLRLRYTSLNYVNLEIDSSTVSWDELLTRFQQKHNLSFVNRSLPNAPIVLASLRYSSYKYLKENVKLSYQKRGVSGIVRTISKVASEHSQPIATVIAGGLTSGAAVFGAFTLAAVEREKVEVEKEKLKLGHRQVALDEKKLDFDMKKFDHVKSQPQNPPSNVSFHEEDYYVLLNYSSYSL